MNRHKRLRYFFQLESPDDQKYLDSNRTFRKLFPWVHVTLICDAIRLDGVDKTAYNSLEKEKTLTRKKWDEVLYDTKEANQDFIRAKNKLIKRESRQRE